MTSVSSIIIAPDFHDKLNEGYNIILTRKVGGNIVQEAFKQVSDIKPRDAGRILHTKLFCQVKKSSPLPGDEIVVLFKDRATQEMKPKFKYVLNEDRKIEYIECRTENNEADMITNKPPLFIPNLSSQ
jgi:hypothetical protein